VTPPPFLFMRIHKTASEALQKQIFDRVPKEDVCPLEFEWAVRTLSDTRLRTYRYFSGHISPAALSETVGPPLVLTMLRDPRERLLSCYYYWKAGASHATGAFFDAIRGLSLLGFLRCPNPIIRRATWNTQARLLAGGQFGPTDEYRQIVYGPWLGRDDLAAEAIHALGRYALVGITEHYELSLRRACELLELGPPPAPERLNITMAKPASYAPPLADPEIVAALDALTDADRAVYQVARSRLLGEAFSSGIQTGVILPGIR
jgi:hypothetical protein